MRLDDLNSAITDTFVRYCENAGLRRSEKYTMRNELRYTGKNINFLLYEYNMGWLTINGTSRSVYYRQVVGADPKKGSVTSKRMSEELIQEFAAIGDFYSRVKLYEREIADYRIIPSIYCRYNSATQKQPELSLNYGIAHYAHGYVLRQHDTDKSNEMRISPTTRNVYSTKDIRTFSIFLEQVPQVRAAIERIYKECDITL